jgi:hypothetical protein
MLRPSVETDLKAFGVKPVFFQANPVDLSDDEEEETVTESVTIPPPAEEAIETRISA